MFDNLESKTNKAITNVSDSKNANGAATAKGKEVVKKKMKKIRDPVFEYFMQTRYRTVLDLMQFDIKKTLAKEKEDRQNYLLS